LEIQFLRIVTNGHRELQEQIENAEVCDYDPNGYCDVRILHGPPSSLVDKCDGPTLSIPGESGSIGTLLWLNKDGMLDTIEFLEDVMGTADIYTKFVNGVEAGWLQYP